MINNAFRGFHSIRKIYIRKIISLRHKNFWNVSPMSLLLFFIDFITIPLLFGVLSIFSHFLSPFWTKNTQFPILILIRSLFFMFIFLEELTVRFWGNFRENDTFDYLLLLSKSYAYNLKMKRVCIAFLLFITLTQSAGFSSDAFISSGFNPNCTGQL